MGQFSTGRCLGPVLKWHPYIYNTAPAVPPHLQFSPPPDRFRRRCCRRSPLRLRPAAAPRLRLRADTPSRLYLRLRDAGPFPPRQRAPPLHAAGASSRAVVVPARRSRAAAAAPPRRARARRPSARPCHATAPASSTSAAVLASSGPDRRRPRAPPPRPCSCEPRHPPRPRFPPHPLPLHTLHPMPVGRGRRPTPGV